MLYFPTIIVAPILVIFEVLISIAEFVTSAAIWFRDVIVELTIVVLDVSNDKKGILSFVSELVRVRPVNRAEDFTR